MFEQVFFTSTELQLGSAHPPFFKGTARMPQLHHTRFRPQLYATDQIGRIRQEHDFHAGNIVQRSHAVFQVLDIGHVILVQRKVPRRLPRIIFKPLK